MRRNAVHTSSLALGGLGQLGAQHQHLRSVHLPGWKTKQSTKDVRTREQREADRKIRQIEKLPRPEALHDFQYPHEKTVLADHMFQPPVFASELDTPHLFNVSCPSDFFLYWNCNDFDRTEYPAVPAKDHRTLIPQTREVAAVDKQDDAASSWVQHRSLAAKYLSKHQVTPNFVPYVSHEANLSVVYSGTYGAKVRRDPETRAALPPPPPVESLNPQNFWFTSHFGNYIELCELQEAPSIFFTTPNVDDTARYTLIIASPDYPYRTKAAMGDSNAGAGGGFFINYMVANLPGGHRLDRKHGDVVVPYVPPLPTEDAGTTRHMCMLFKQFRAVPNVKALLGTPPASSSSAALHLDFKNRCNFTLHGNDRREHHHHGETLLSSLHHVERSLPADPVALTMFQTSWDIQVQEFYEAVGEPEPAFQLDEEIEAILRYNSLTSSDLQVRARHQPDGATNMGMIEHQLVQWQPTRMMQGSMNSLWSRRTQLGTNNKHQLTPKKH